MQLCRAQPRQNPKEHPAPSTTVRCHTRVGLDQYCADPLRQVIRAVPCAKRTPHSAKGDNRAPPHQHHQYTENTTTGLRQRWVQAANQTCRAQQLERIQLTSTAPVPPPDPLSSLQTRGFIGKCGTLGTQPTTDLEHLRQEVPIVRKGRHSRRRAGRQRRRSRRQRRAPRGYQPNRRHRRPPHHPGRGRGRRRRQRQRWRGWRSSGWHRRSRRCGHRRRSGGSRGRVSWWRGPRHASERRREPGSLLPCSWSRSPWSSRRCRFAEQVRQTVGAVGVVGVWRRSQEETRPSSEHICGGG